MKLKLLKVLVLKQNKEIARAPAISLLTNNFRLLEDLNKNKHLNYSIYWRNRQVGLNGS